MWRIILINTWLKNLFKSDNPIQIKVLIYFLINQIGTFTSYLAIVAIPHSKEKFLFNLGIFFTAKYLGGAVSYKAVSYLVKKFGEKKMIIFSNILSGVLLLLVLLYSDSIYIIPCLLFAIGFLFNLHETSFNNYLPKILPNKLLLNTNQNLQLVGYSTMVIGAGLGGFLIDNTGITGALIFDAGTYIFSGIIVYILLPSPSDKGQDKIQQEEPTFREKTKSEPTWLNNSFQSILILFSFHIATGIVCCIFDYIEIPYYLDTLGLKFSHIGPFFSVSILGILLGKLLINKLKNHMKTFRSITLFHILTGVSFLSLSFTNNLLFAALGLMSFIGFLSLARSSTLSLFQSIESPEKRVYLLSVRHSISSAISVLITFIAALMSRSVDISQLIQIAFLFLFGICLIAIAFFLQGRKKWYYSYDS